MLRSLKILSAADVSHWKRTGIRIEIAAKVMGRGDSGQMAHDIVEIQWNA